MDINVVETGYNGLHIIESILIYNIYCIDFNHQKLVVTIGDYLMRTSMYPDTLFFVSWILPCTG